MSSIRDFIDAVGSGDNINAQKHFDDIFTSKSYEFLDAKKHEMAASLFSNSQEEYTQDTDK